MATPDAHAPVQTPSKRLQFARYVLDLDRGCLLFGDNEIALRPKTFAVLQHLVENPGRLVAKDELLSGIWSNLSVTDDALVQSISELRRALGDDGPRLIKTVPRRGYRFESAVSVQRSSVMDAATVSAARQQVAPSREPAGDTPASERLFTQPNSRVRLPGLAVLAALVAGLISISVGTNWDFSGLLRGDSSSPLKAVEIGAKPAIAVLPLVDQNNDPSREYFVDGLTQDIINALGRYAELTVMSWNAVYPYKGKPPSPEEVARVLGVRYQVEGSVRQTADSLRVSAQLVDGNGRVLWSDSLDGTQANVFELQDRITSQIAGALAIRVERSEERRVAAKPTENVAAYDYVLRARPALQRPTRKNIAEARVLLRKAIDIDPNYAAAFAALAETYYVATSMGWAESPTMFLRRAQEMADKALRLGTSEVRAHVVLGRIDIFRHRYEQALTEMDRAIAINPNDANALAGKGNVLMWRGKTDAAIEALQQALRIDPELNPIDRFALSLAYYLKGRYDASIEQARSNLRNTEGANFSRIVLAAAYAQLNRPEDVTRTVAMIRRLDPTFDAQGFGSKFLNPADLERLRGGLRKAGLYADDASLPPAGHR